MSKEIRDDKRKNNSRPPLPEIDRKVPIVIYKRRSEIRSVGKQETLKKDMAKVRENLSTLFDEMLEAS
jgi:hypothetical protein